MMMGIADGTPTILVIGFGGKGVGDQVIATPFLRSLKANLPQARIDYGASSQAGVELLQRDPHLRDCFVLDMDCFRLGGKRSLGDKLACLALLRSKRYDRVYLLNTKLRAALAALLTGASERIGFASYHREFLLTRYWQEPLEKNLVDRFLDLLAYDDMTVGSNQVQLYLEQSESAAAAQRLAGLFPDGRPVVALAPCAADMRRTWGVRRFSELAGWCISQDMRVVLLGSAADREHLSGFPESSYVVDLAGTLSLRETAALISRVAAFVGNDSGLAHVAGGVGTYGIVIGYHVTKVWYPSAQSIETIIKDPGCISCDLNSCYPGNHNQPPCFEAVTVDEVAVRLKRIVRESCENSLCH